MSILPFSNSVANLFKKTGDTMKGVLSFGNHGFNMVDSNGVKWGCYVDTNGNITCNKAGGSLSGQPIGIFPLIITYA